MNLSHVRKSAKPLETSVLIFKLQTKVTDDIAKLTEVFQEPHKQ